MNTENANLATSASNSITIRLMLDHRAGVLAKATAVIGENGGNIGAIDIIRIDGDKIARDISVDTAGPDHSDRIVAALKKLEGLEVAHVSDRTFLMHLGGKIEVRSKVAIKTRDELSMAYTPGVARVCMAIHEEPENAFKLTIKKNMVAVVSDGSAVLGLGDIGPEAAMPVMEGKAMLFKDFGGVDAFPICLNTQDTNEIVNIVKAISPGFGGINLEDISAPRCFEIERRLRSELDIPVFHDDQHGTAVVMAAALINSLKIVDKRIEDIKVVLAGAGAAGVACAEIMLSMGARNIVATDRKGVLSKSRKDLNDSKRRLAEMTNPEGFEGQLRDAIRGADLFVGVSGPGILSVDDIKTMAKDPIVFAMANPTPEVPPEEAEPHVAVMATGRSDYPNQINNVLCFPGIFRGALDCRATEINEAMKKAAAQAIASAVDEASLSPQYVVPSVFDKSVAQTVAQEVAKAAIETGVSRRGY